MISHTSRAARARRAGSGVALGALGLCSLMKAPPPHPVVGALLHSTSLYQQHTHAIHLSTLEHLSGSCGRCSLLWFLRASPLSHVDVACRCGRHAHIAGCGTGSRHRLCLGRTHTSVRASVISVASGVISQVIADPGVLWGIAVACGAAIRGPSRPTAWEIVRGKGRVAVPVNIAVVIVAVARPRAADEQLVGGGGDNSGSPPRGPRA